MAEPERNYDEVDEVLLWLAREPDGDPLADLAMLRTNVRRVAASAGQRRRQVLAQFGGRALDICGRFRPRLLAASLPLPRELHAAAGMLAETLLEIVAGIGALTERSDSAPRRAPAGELAALQGLASALLGEGFIIGAMAAAAPPAGLWRAAHALAAADGSFDAVPHGEAGSLPDQALHYRRLLAVAAAQPESFSARELSWLFDYLGMVAGFARLSATVIEPRQLAYWLDPLKDAAPAAFARRPPPDDARLLYASFAELAQQVSERIAWLETRMVDFEVSGAESEVELLVADDSGLPVGLTPTETLSILRRLRDRWAAPPLREQPRRQHQYAVQVCIGLRSMWELGRGRREQGRVVEWLVLNESPGGYAIMSVAGVQGSIAAGIALALRRESSQPWSVCIVRWVRSDNPDQFELGLQIMSQSYTSVQIGFRGSEMRTTVPALSLPVLEAVRRHSAILAPAGTYVSRRFVLVRESEHLYVAQGRALGLDMQTANVELFQYETDPYPI